MNSSNRFFMIIYCDKCGRELIVHRNSMLIKLRDGSQTFADHLICSPCGISVCVASSIKIKPEHHFPDDMIDINFSK